MKYKILKSSSGIVNPIDRIQARFSGMVGESVAPNVRQTLQSYPPPTPELNSPPTNSQLIKAFVLFRERERAISAHCLRVEK